MLRGCELLDHQIGENPMKSPFGQSGSGRLCDALPEHADIVIVTAALDDGPILAKHGICAAWMLLSKPGATTLRSGTTHARPQCGEELLFAISQSSRCIDALVREHRSEKPMVGRATKDQILPCGA
jgi:hypothetical protein